MKKNFDVSAVEIGNVVRVLLETGSAKVTSYLSPTQTVKASRVTILSKKKWRRDFGDDRGRANIRLTIGEPNYAERRFIKLCKKAGEPFPVKKLQIRMIPA